MASRIYISTIVFVLIGGTLSFGYWSLGQFNLAFNSFEASQSQLSASLTSNTKPVLNNAVATTTAGGAQVATTTSDVSVTFSAKGDDVYIGCTYQISFQSSTSTVRSFEAALIDTGTGETVGPIASGLAKTNNLKPNSKNLDWKVGEVWSSEYVILVSKINSVEIENKSESFTIRKMPENISATKRVTMCKESGGSL